MDPFSLVYGSLWDAVEASDDLRVIRQGNRISFLKEISADYDPRRVGITANNSPELMLLPDHFNTNFTQDNVSSSLERAFNFVLRTSSILLDKSIFPLEWALFKALRAHKPVIEELEFEGKRFVQNMSLGKTTVYLPEKGAAISGWRCLWTVYVDMEFGR